MFSPSLLSRQFQASQFDRMLQGVVGRTLPVPVTLRIRLGASPVCVVGLGLRRLSEMSYGPSDLAEEMVAFLQDRQEADGAFDGGDPLATACAAAGLQAAIGAGDNRADLAEAVNRAMASLAAGQDDRPPLWPCEKDRTLTDRALTSAMVICLLAGVPAFRDRTRFADAVAWFSAGEAALAPDVRRFWQLARCEVSGRSAGLSRAA